MIQPSARVRVYAQIGEHGLLHTLADDSVTSHAELAQLLRALADEYAEKLPDLSGILSP